MNTAPEQPLTPTTEIAERLTEYWKAARDSRSLTVILPIALTHGAITALRNAEMETAKASEWARMQTTRMERAEKELAEAHAAQIPKGISRAEWHDKAWALFHAKTFEDTMLHKVNIHTMRAVFDATYDAIQSK